MTNQSHHLRNALRVAASSWMWIMVASATSSTAQTGTLSARSTPAEATSLNAQQISKVQIDSRSVGAVPEGKGKGGARAPRPSLIADSGVGTGAYLKLSPGSNDKRGIVAIETGTGPASDSGVFSLRFGTRLPARTSGCLTPKSGSAKAAHVDDFFPVERYGFVVYVHHQALEPHTFYVWRYEIGPDCAHLKAE